MSGIERMPEGNGGGPEQEDINTEGVLGGLEGAGFPEGVERAEEEIEEDLERGERDRIRRLQDAARRAREGEDTPRIGRRGRMGAENTRELEQLLAQDTEGQINWLSDRMSRLESLKRSYETFTYDESYMEMRQMVQILSPEVRNYFVARMQLFDAWLIAPRIKGSIDAFLKLGETAGLMTWQDTMLSRKEVAQAFSDFEGRSNNIEYTRKKVRDPATGRESETGEEVLRRDNNPAFANAEQLEKIRDDMALSLAKRNGQVAENVTKDSTEGKAAINQNIWAVRQAEVIWRMWMRAALKDGPVFKAGTSEGTRKRLSSLHPVHEIPRYWNALKDNLELKGDEPDSFSGSGEFAVKRLMHSSLFAERNKTGEASMRSSLWYGSKDYLSYYLGSESFVIDPNNFKDNQGFRFESADNFGKTYVKTGPDGITEKLIIKRNGVVELGDNFDMSKVKWTVKGDDAYIGTFATFNLVMADKLREFLVTPEKFARDPSLHGLRELLPGLEHIPTLMVDLENGIDVEAKRKEGKVYREDVVYSLTRSLLRFQKEELYHKYRIHNLNSYHVNAAIENLRARGVLTNEAERKLKEELIHPSPVVRFALVGNGATNPPGMLWAMLLEIIKKSVQM